MRIMAIDYGDARIGLAVSDPTATLVGEAWTMAEYDMDRAAARIAQEAQARGVERFVLGLPKNMDGTEGSRAAKSRRFAQRLANAAQRPVVLWDERRTTVSAAAILAGNDTFGQKRKERLDSVSAAVILESFLNWRAHHPGEEPPEQLQPQAPENP